MTLPYTPPSNSGFVSSIYMIKIKFVVHCISDKLQFVIKLLRSVRLLYKVLIVTDLKKVCSCYRIKPNKDVIVF